MSRPIVACMLLSAWMLAGAVSARADDGPASAPIRPNFVIILADDLSAADLGCYGAPGSPTPNIDELARRGVRYSVAWATPICSPSRMQLLTGQYGFRTGWCNLMGRPFTPKTDSPRRDMTRLPTFASILKANGYATALSGKWQLPGVIPTLVHEAGFDTYRLWAYRNNYPAGVTHTGQWENDFATSRFWHPGIIENGKVLPTKPEDYGPDLFTSFALDFIRANRDGPFALYYTAVQTHTPYAEVPDPAHPGQRLPGTFQSNLAHLDRIVGQITAEIDRLGLAERTVIFFIGDNCSAHMAKGKIDERAVRVPMIVRAPTRVREGVVSEALVDLSDVLPTLVELAGAPLPKDVRLDGVSMVPSLTGKPGKEREWIFSYLALGRLLRTRDHMVIDPGDPEPRLRFFESGSSPAASDHQDITESSEPAHKQSREHLEQLLRSLPRPTLDDDLIPPKPATRPARR